MENTIKELWYGNVCACEKCGRITEEEKELSDLILRNRTKLEECLNESEKETLEKYVDCLNELSCIEETKAFVEGFRLGIRIFFDALS